MPDIVTSKVFVDGEKGITATKLNQIISGSVIQPDFVGTKPSASSVASTDQMLVLNAANSYVRAPFSVVSSSVAGLLPLADATQNGMLRQVSGLTTDVVDGTNHCVNPAAMPGITQMRLRSFQAIGNSTFECDQRQCGTALTNPANGIFVQDRWAIVKSGLTGTVNTALQTTPTAPIVIPGTNFGITQNYQRFTVGTAQASLAAGDSFGFTQYVEGPLWRELALDVHSVQLLVRSSVAISFALRLRDPTTTRSLVKLCTISSPNVWQLIPLANLPVWVGTYSAAPGGVGYNLDVFLACGSTYLAAANTAFQNGDIRGVTGMSNFLSTAGATFDIAYAGHEPGPLCTTPQDCPFTQNYDQCLRYYSKSYPYSVKAGTSGYEGYELALLPLGTATASLRVNTKYIKPMAKAPGVTLYAYDGTANNVTVVNTSQGSGNIGVSSVSGPTERGFGFITMSGSSATTHYAGYFHYVADTGF